MFDTMTLTKAVGAICAGWLVLLLGGLAAKGLYSVGGEEDGRLAGYEILVQEAEDGTGGEEVVEVPFAEILAAADPADGQGLWRQCASCHVVDPGVNRTGPTLFGVVGRDIGSVEGFGYSETLASLEGDWTPEMLNGFLENPRGFADGTIMSFSGFRDVEDRAAMIAYLDSLDD
jgi:cytochrome c